MTDDGVTVTAATNTNSSTNEIEGRRDELLLSCAKRLVVEHEEENGVKRDEDYVAVLVLLSKLSSPLTVAVLVEDIVQQGGMLAFILRLIRSYLSNSNNDCYLTLSLNILCYIFSSPSENESFRANTRATITGAALMATPLLIQVLRTHSSLHDDETHNNTTTTVLAIDVQIVEILRHVLVHHHLKILDCHQHNDNTRLLLPTIIQRYRHSLLLSPTPNSQQQQQQQQQLQDYRNHVISILQYVVLISTSCTSLLLLSCSSSALLEFLEFAPCHLNLYHLALQWCVRLFILSNNNSISSSSSSITTYLDDDGPFDFKNAAAQWKELFKNSSVRLLFSNFILFGFKHCYNNNGIHTTTDEDILHVEMTNDNNIHVITTTATTAAILQCDLFQTIALALENVGCHWSIEHHSAIDTTNNNNNSNKGIALITCICMASGELRISLDQIIDIGRDDFGQQDHEILSNTVLHCIRILLEIVQELIMHADWVNVLHFETILRIKESLEDAISKMFQFVAAATNSLPAPYLEITSTNTDEHEDDEQHQQQQQDQQSLLIFDSIILLCSKCLRVWLSENYDNDNKNTNNISGIHITTEHEMNILHALLEEENIYAQHE